jgi:hypothetical protein
MTMTNDIWAEHQEITAQRDQALEDGDCKRIGLPHPRYRGIRMADRSTDGIVTH